MIKLEEIKKENCITEPYEYLFIENFIENLNSKDIYNEYISTATIVDEDEAMCSMTAHMVEDVIRENKDVMLQKINQMWDLEIVDIWTSMNMFTKPTHHLPIHNDYHCVEKSPVRGILYCNPEKVFGTAIHDNELNPNGENVGGKLVHEAGGNPGDLLLIKVSQKSWHSTQTKKDTDTNRLTCNMFFVPSMDVQF